MKANLDKAKLAWATKKGKLELEVAKAKLDLVKPKGRQERPWRSTRPPMILQ